MRRRKFIAQSGSLLFGTSSSLLLVGCGGGGSAGSPTQQGVLSSAPPPAPASSPAPTPAPTAAPAPAPAPTAAKHYGLVTQYDLSDPDIVFARTLTTAPATMPSSAAREFGTCTGVLAQTGLASLTFDPILGMTSEAGAFFLIEAMNQYQDLQAAGQCFFEIERSYLSVLGAQSLGSDGTSLPTAQRDTPVSVCQQPYGVPFIEMTIDATKTVQITNFSNDTSGHFNDLMIPPDQGFVGVVVWWSATEFGIYVNGRALGVPFARAVTPPGSTEDLSLGPVTGGHIRNVLLVKRAPSFLAPPGDDFTTFCIFGDSYSSSGPNPEGAQTYDAAIQVQVESVLGLAGYFLNWPYETPSDVYSQTFPGNHIMGYSSDPPLDLAVDNEPPTNSTLLLWNQIPVLLSLQPTCVLLQAGVNDWFNPATESFGHLDGARFLRWLKRLVQKILGLDTQGFGTYPETSVKRMFIGTTPYAPLGGNSGGLPATPEIAAARAKDAQTDAAAKLAAIAWFDAAYPARAGALTLIDVLSAFGGLNANADLFASDYLHPNNLGTGIMGHLYGEAILAAF